MTPLRKQLDRRLAQLRAEYPQLLSPQPEVYQEATKSLLDTVSLGVLVELDEPTLLTLQRRIEAAVQIGMSEGEMESYVSSFGWRPLRLHPEPAKWLEEERGKAPRDNVVLLHATRAS